MPVQQVSSGGSTIPMTPVRPPASPASTPQNTASVPIVSGANALYQLTPVTDTGIVNGFDPYNYMTEDRWGGDANWSAKTTPGYQAYGDDWLTLLNTLRRMPAGVGTGIQPELLERTLSPEEQQKADYWTHLGIKQGDKNRYSSQRIDVINPLNQTGALARTIKEAVMRGADPAEFALPEVSRTFGLDPSSPSAKRMTEAYITYLTQRNTTDTYKNALAESKHSGFMDSPLGSLLPLVMSFIPGLQPLAAFAAAVQGFRHNDPLAVIASAANGIGAGGATGSAAQAAKTIGLGAKAGSLGRSIAAGDPFGIVSNALSTATSGADLYDSYSAPAGGTPGTSGTNAPSASGGTMSAVSKALGLEPDELKTGLEYLGVGGTLAKTVMPYLQGDSSTSPDSASASVPSSNPTLAASAPVGTVRPSGSALPSLEEAPNPAKALYKKPKAGSSNLGGSLGVGSSSGSRTGSMLRAIGA